ncbi:MAG: hypothetical protein GF353_22850 [Candidatus Lokiarchaeota archaeon]|nr:hypothetical protein [Candidatus Lokiarchaeota archaeon]
MKKKEYYCPRCGSKDIVDYGDSFDCKHCVLEFDKKDFDQLPDKEDVLALEEKREIVHHFRED